MRFRATRLHGRIGRWKRLHRQYAIYVRIMESPLDPRGGVHSEGDSSLHI